MADLKKEIENRRTFAIISHPDAGKTTITEKFLLYGGAIQEAGMVKGKKNSRHAVSDWMEIEKQRGISDVYKRQGLRRRRAKTSQLWWFYRHPDAK